jgi:hypothetical protein
MLEIKFKQLLKKRIMRKRLFLSAIALFAFSCGCFANTQSIQSKINQVTVFKSGAFVERDAYASLKAGTTTLNIKGLSPSIDPNGILVKVNNEKVKLISVNHEFDFAKRDNTLKQLQDITTESDKLKDSIAQINNQLEILKEEWNFLVANNSIKGNNGLQVNELDKMAKYYKQSLVNIKNSQLQLEKKKKEFSQRYIDQTQKQIALNQMANEYSGQLQILVSCESDQHAEIDITYFVADAGWTPFYDIRIPSLKSPLEMSYKALVHQNSLEDWNDVTLRISNINPTSPNVTQQQTPSIIGAINKDTKSAQILPKHTFKKNIRGIVCNARGPLQYACINVKGSDTYAITDENGAYSISVPDTATMVFSYLGYKNQIFKLEPGIGSVLNVTLAKAKESQASDIEALDINIGYNISAPIEKIMDGNTSGAGKQIINNSFTQKVMEGIVPGALSVQDFILTVDNKYTIKSSNQSTNVLIKEYVIPSEYKYICFPKKDKLIHLTAKIPDWTQYSLLDGPAHIFMNNEFKGTAMIVTNALNDTLDLHIGSDKEIKVSREKVLNKSNKQFMVSSQKEVRTWEITVWNNKNVPVAITLEDQYPLSNDSEVEVKLLNSGSATVNPKTGSLIWDLNLDAHEVKKLTFSYQVKYPIGDKILVE